ncbi:hypothetical protein LCGC14_1311310 [marine sediment metagenome]|uniref:Uncharacterized protein n=1 Tax=marine sediment metagenome TaxID=412755 RepID=A0A0F9L7A9_9ZZZZ
MDVNIEEREDVIVATINGVVYELSREITGGQFMELRKKAIRPVITEDESQTGRLEIDSIEFDFWNLLFRLRSPEMTREELLALPRVAYHSLTLLAGKMDNDEAQGVADFLRDNSSIFQVSLSTLEPSLDSPLATSEAVSE